jgi:hypothetical protein
MRKIKMLSTAAGPKGSFQKGAIVQLDDATARVWVQGGAASYVEEAKPRVVDRVEEVEEATVAAPERAVRRRVKRSRKKK